MLREGVGADIAVLSIERDADRLKQGGFVASDWHNLPQRRIVNKMPFVILVQAGNSKAGSSTTLIVSPVVS